MKLMVTSLILILLIPLTFSLEFGLDSPETVNSNEEFTATINADTSDIYDVKIFIHEPIKEFSEIYDGSSWRSPYRYLNSAFPEKKDFKLKAYYQGETKLCARLRKSGETPFEEKCNKIIVNPAPLQEQYSQSDNGSNNNPNNNTLQEPSSEETKNQEQESKQYQKQEEKTKQNKSQLQIENIVSETTSNQETQEKLILNPKSQKPLRTLNNSKIQNQESFITKYEKIRLAIVYSFTAICIFIIILLALKKL